MGEFPKENATYRDVLDALKSKSKTWNCSPSETWQAGESTESSKPKESTQKPAPEPTPEPSNTCTYICNTNTHKFHYPDCSSVKRMADKNKKEVTTTREDLISQGYEPCGNCNP